MLSTFALSFAIAAPLEPLCFLRFHSPCRGRFWSCVLLLIEPTMASSGAAPGERGLQPMDVFELEIGASPRVSPDGEQVVYVRRSMDIMTDSMRSNIWIIDADGENHRPLLSGPSSYSNPVWSPSGDRIAYVADAGGIGRQLFVRWQDTGQTALPTLRSLAGHWANSSDQ